MSIEAAAALPAEVDQAIKAFLPYINTALDSLGFPKVVAELATLPFVSKPSRIYELAKKISNSLHPK